MTNRNSGDVATEVKEFAPSLKFRNPNAVCWTRNGFLIVVESNRVLTFPAAEFFYEGPDVAVGEVVPQGQLIPPEEESFNHSGRVCRIGPTTSSTSRSVSRSTCSRARSSRSTPRPVSAESFASAWAADAIAGKARAQACVVCHGALGLSTLPDAPNLAAQPAIYLSAQLRAFRSGERRHEVMNVIAKPLTDDDIDNLVAWFASVRIEAHAPQ